MCFSVSKLTILVDQSNYLLIAKTVYLKLRKMFVTVTNCTFCSYKQFFSEMEEILSYGYNKNGCQNQIDTSSKWYNFHNHTFICRVCIIIYCFIVLKLFIWFPSLFEYCAAHGYLAAGSVQILLLLTKFFLCLATPASFTFKSSGILHDRASWW